VPEPEWLNRTINIDTVVFLAESSRHAYPEKNWSPFLQKYLRESREPFLPAETMLRVVGATTA